MNPPVFLIASATALLLACGKAEEAAAPAGTLAVPAPPQAEPAPVALPVETPPALQAAAAPRPEATPAAESTPAPQPVAAPAPRPVTASKPAAVRPDAADRVESAPAAEPVDEAATSAPKPDLARGQQVYRQACAFCHDKGVAGAPKAGDAAAWGPRLAQGMDALYASALQGKGAMPARGGNPVLADPDVKAAVDHLAAQSR
ncbi:c-type cytochrome [Thiobacillus denitrificans]|uniref:c-type cytochrome n=1 Tax=Thiobacillus denitrificans TaxID=36861 RepID=UPI0009DB5BA0|nr:c-type cytochrome [Thiobacillus denitrificans]